MLLSRNQSIYRHTGVLRYFPEGFAFDLLTPSAIFDTVRWALWAWYNRPEHILAMRQRAMQQRFSWGESAQRYVELYHRAMDRRRNRTSKTQ